MSKSEGTPAEAITEPNATADIDPSSQPQDGMSKNRRKKYERIARRKRKMMEKKEEKKAKKRMLREEQAAEAQSKGSSTEGEEERRAKTEANRQLRRHIREEFKKACDHGPLIVLDFDSEWNKLMGVMEMRSLAQQIMYCYGCNRRSLRPVRICLTGIDWSSIIGEALQKHDGFKNGSWIAMECTDKGLGEELEARRVALETSRRAERAAEDSRGENREKDVILSCEDAKNDGGGVMNVVYLTSDAEETLEDLPWDSNTTYVIGAIVDRNRHPRASYDKACRMNIRTAKLPLQQHCTLKTSKVLTVNHVFEILVRCAALGSWPKAFAATLPTRKEPQLRADALKEESGDDDPDKLDDEDIPPWLKHTKFF